MIALTSKPRPITPVDAFEQAIEKSNLTPSERQLIDYIRYIGTFTQVSLSQALKLKTKPPVLSILCGICRKIGDQLPEHFEQVRQWSEEMSEDNVRWDGELICSTAWTIDGERLTPEAGTTQFHTFVVHKELFIGLG